MLRIVVPIVLCLAIAGVLEGAESPMERLADRPDEPSATIHPETVIEHLAKGELDAVVAIFDATMTEALPKAQLRSVWGTLITQTGAYKSHGEPQVTTQKDYRVALVPMVFENAALHAKIVYDAEGKIAGLFFLPAPDTADPQPPGHSKVGAFKEISLVAGNRGWPLPATLSLPQGDGPFPAVVLVHGSGPHDRDETVGGAKPFRDLAAGLASRNIAVLRYEKRTLAFASKIVADRSGTVAEEVVDDAVAAVALLRKTAGIDPARVFVVGHSLGGMMLPRIAAKDTRIAGLISMAGPGRPLEDLLVDQTRHVLDASGASDEVQKTKIAEMEKIVRRIKDPRFGKDVRGESILGAWPKYWIDIRGYKAPEAARAITRPFLILQGERDYQVTMRDFALWKEGLAGRADATFKSYPKLNHLFVEGTGPSTPAEYELRANVSETVIVDIATWIASLALER